MKRLIYLILLLLLLICDAWAVRIIPLPGHLKPFRIRVEGERIFIAEGPVIYIYREKDMALLYKFGKAGEGPKEFKLFPEEAPELDVHRDTILATSVYKITFFTGNGEYIREKRFKEGGRRQYFRLMGDRLLAENRTVDKNILFRTLRIYDMEGNKIRELFRYKHFAQRGKQYNPITRGLYLNNFYISRGKIFLGGAIYSGTIHVFDLKGKKLYQIKPDFEKIEFTAKDRQGYIDSWLSNSQYMQYYKRIKDRFKYPAYFPFWQDFVVSGDKIYVQTYKRNKEDTHNEFYILSLKGELLKRVWLPLGEFFDFTPSPYTIYNGKLYQMLDNEDTEEWELHIVLVP